MTACDPVNDIVPYTWDVPSGQMKTLKKNSVTKNSIILFNLTNLYIIAFHDFLTLMEDCGTEQPSAFSFDQLSQIPLSLPQMPQFPGRDTRLLVTGLGVESQFLWSVFPLTGAGRQKTWLPEGCRGVAPPSSLMSHSSGVKSHQ